MFERILVSISIILLLVVAPWWVGVSVAVLALAYFPLYLELFLFALLLDLLFAGGSVTLWGIPLIYTSAAVILYVVVAYIKKRLLVYHPYHV